MRRVQSIVACSALLVAALAVQGTAEAQVILEPGGEHEFATADACAADQEVPNLIDALAGADSDCSASERRMKAQLRPILGAGWVGFQTVKAFASLSNDFEIAGDPETLGNTVLGLITYEIDFTGRMVFVGFLSNPTVQFWVELHDLTLGKVLKNELIWARDGEGLGIGIPNIPIDFNVGGGTDVASAANTFVAVLTRGHTYRIEFHLVCAVWSDGGLDLGTVCDYMDNVQVLVGPDDGGAGWSRLAVKVGVDERELLGLDDDEDEDEDEERDDDSTGDEASDDAPAGDGGADSGSADGDAADDGSAGGDDAEDDPPGPHNRPWWWPWR